MAIMSAEVQELFAAAPAVVFMTATPDGQPNGSIVGMKRVIDDETLYVSDQFFKKTLDYVQANEKVAVVFWVEHTAYQIYGTARYVNEGPEYQEQADWANGLFESKDSPLRAKGGCFIHVDAVYVSTPGPTAGDQIA